MATELARAVATRMLDDAKRWSDVLGPCFDVDGVRRIQDWARHDPSAGARTVALLDAHGEHRPFGWAWRTVTSSPLDDPFLLDELAARGLGVADIPRDLPTVRPASGS